MTGKVLTFELTLTFFLNDATILRTVRNTISIKLDQNALCDHVFLDQKVKQMYGK